MTVPFTYNFQSFTHVYLINSLQFPEVQLFTFHSPGWAILISYKERKPKLFGFKNVMETGIRKLRICSCLACIYRVMDTRGNFWQHERCVRVARGTADSNSSFLSALQTSQVNPQLDIPTAKSMSKFFYDIADKNACFFIICKFL